MWRPAAHGLRTGPPSSAPRQRQSKPRTASSLGLPRPSPGQAPANRQMYSGWPRPTLIALLPHDQETLCAGESLGSTHVLTGAPPRARLQPFAYFRSSWVGPQQSDRRGVYRCHAVHGHGYADEQVERLLLAPEIAPVWDRGRLVGPDFVG